MVKIENASVPAMKPSCTMEVIAAWSPEELIWSMIALPANHKDVPANWEKIMMSSSAFFRTGMDKNKGKQCGNKIEAKKVTSCLGVLTNKYRPINPESPYPIPTYQGIGI